MLGNVKMNDLPTGMPENDHDVEKPERAGDYDEHIQGGDAVDMVPQEGPPRRGGDLDRLIMYLATTVWPMRIPSLRSSPWIRGAPHSGLAWLIWRIRARTSWSTAGRPRRPKLERQRQ